MSDTALNRIIQYGTEAERLAFTPNPASGSQLLYIWYQTDEDTEPSGMYVWQDPNWILVNPPAPREIIKRKAWVNCAAENQFEQVVGMPSLSVGGGRSNGSTNELVYTRYSTPTLNAELGFNGNGAFANTYFILNENRILFKIRTGPSINNLRWWLVLGNGSLGTASDSPNAHYIGFRYSTSVPDPGWIGVCCDGVALNQQITANFATIAINTSYELEVIYKDGIASFYIDGIHIGDLSTNLPTAAMGLWAKGRNLASESKQVLISFVYSESL